MQQKIPVCFAGNCKIDADLEQVAIVSKEKADALGFVVFNSA